MVEKPLAVQRQSTKRTSSRKSPSATSPLMVRLDAESKACLTEAARLRGLSLSDYVRTITVPQARKEILAASAQTLVMTAEEQRAFWSALQQPVTLTPAQIRLGAIMRGEQ